MTHASAKFMARNPIKPIFDVQFANKIKKRRIGENRIDRPRSKIKINGDLVDLISEQFAVKIRDDVP